MRPKPERQALVGIACMVFYSELERLRQEGRIDFPIWYLGANLHMAPEILGKRMAALVGHALGQGLRVVLIYGDCHPYITDLESSSRVVRVRGVNCGEIFLGKDSYRRLIRQGGFYLVPKWALRWREMLADLMNLGEQTAIEIMRECHRKLVYLDTGVFAVPIRELQACSGHFGIPYETLGVSLDHLGQVIDEAILKIRGKGCLS